MPDAKGKLGPVALGFDTLGEYEDDPAFIGPIIGPVANRISGAEFTLDGKRFELDKNDDENCLHSGRTGWHRQLWDAEINGTNLHFTLQTQDGTGGFPANIAAELIISFDDDGRLTYLMSATTDAPTPIAITRHEYFNLSDGGASRVDDHVVHIFSQSSAELDAQMCATGQILSLRDHGAYLGSPTQLSAKQSQNGALSFDQHYIVPGDGLRHMARIESSVSSRRLDVHATADGVQFYTGQHLPHCEGRGGLTYGASHGLAVEAQARPNAVNLPEFPSIILRPGERYENTIIYHFGLID